jgi:hypothetical protein
MSSLNTNTNPFIPPLYTSRGDKSNTLFDHDNPSMTVVIRLKPVVIAGDHSVRIVEQEILNIVEVIFL